NTVCPRVTDESAERSPIRQQYREVIQPQSSGGRYRRGTSTLMEPDDRRIRIRGPEPYGSAACVQPSQSENALVISERALQIRHLEIDRSEHRIGRQSPTL